MRWKGENIDTITNYYERQVFDEIAIASSKRNLTLNENAILDIACIALNQLPARYVRHQVDTVFYSRDEDNVKMSSEIESAVSNAIDKVMSNPH